VAENRVPTQQEIDFQRYIGRQSVALGCPLHALIAAYHIGYRELWPLLVEQAVAVGGDAPLLLLGGGTTIWERIHATTNALTEGYTEVLAQQEAMAMRTTSQLVEAVLADPASDECRELAMEAGFDPDADFVALSVIGPVSSFETARTVVGSLRRRGVVASSAQRARVVVVLCQGANPQVLDEALAEAAPDAPIGVGTQALRLDGARVSLHESERALELAQRRGRPCLFERDWLMASVMSQSDSVERLLAHGTSLAREKPHLADAVREFARSSFSIAEGARRLGVSHTSFRYRLSRWEELTGWDPWTFDGLSRSLVSLELAGVE
jgi:hypothetical protein